MVILNMTKGESCHPFVDNQIRFDEMEHFLCSLTFAQWDGSLHSSGAADSAQVWKRDTELDGSLPLPSVLPGSVADKKFGLENLDLF